MKDVDVWEELTLNNPNYRQVCKELAVQLATVTERLAVLEAKAVLPTDTQDIRHGDPGEVRGRKLRH